MKTQYSETVNNLKPDNETVDRVVQLWNELRKKADGEFKSPEDFLYLPISNFVPHVKAWSGIKHVILVGIGGSSLGTKAVYDAIYGYFDPVTPDRFPKLHVLENVDARYANALIESLHAEGSPETYFVIVSKSGKTFETMKTLEHLSSGKYTNKEELFRLINSENTYFVTVEGSPLDKKAEDMAPTHPIPQCVSGRFQVFSAVGVVPLTLAGINTLKFIEGAKQSVNSSEEPQRNATLRFQYYQAGLTSDVYFVFDDRLKILAEWMCSITAESLGKTGAGITPIASVGSKDNHAMTQLYLQGRRDKFTTFISLSDTDKDNLRTLEAVKKAYDNASLPYTHITLESYDTNILTLELGSFMQSKIMETVLLGGLMGVNPYDQPGVELYKKYLE